jgi:hypothetical protein
LARGAHIFNPLTLALREGRVACGRIILCSDAFGAADAGNMQGANHDGVFTVRQGDNDLVTDNRGIFGMFDAEDLAAAAMDRERCEGSAFQI